MVRSVHVALALVALIGLGSCRETEDCDSQGAADCAALVRFEGRTYRQFDHVEGSPLTRVAGTAEKSTCEDMGCDPRGAYFPDDARTIRVRRLATVDVEEALAVRGPEGLTEIYVEESIGERRAKQIVAAAR